MKVSASASTGFRIHTRLVPPTRKILEALSLGLVSKCPGPPAKTRIARASAFCAIPPAVSTPAFKAAPGLTIFRSCLLETPTHETAANRLMCSAGLRRRRPRRRGRLVTGRARNRGGHPLRVLGRACLCDQRRTRTYLAALAANARPQLPCIRADSLSRHRLCLRHPHRAPTPGGRDSPSFSRHSGVSDHGRLAFLRVVPHDAWFYCGRLWHPSAFDL